MNLGKGLILSIVLSCIFTLGCDDSSSDEASGSLALEIPSRSWEGSSSAGNNTSEPWTGEENQGREGTEGSSTSLVECIPSCDSATCGDDGCGGLCGSCPTGFFCQQGQCQEGECEANCQGQSCGDDGCGALCGVCDSDAVCVEGQCITSACQPSCDGVTCGGDGCGGTCGTCEAGYECEGGQCAYNPCTDDPCAIPPQDSIPEYCVGNPLCASDADCLGNWVMDSTCEDGVCVQEMRNCQADNDCYNWCLETYADTYSQVAGFSYCEDQFWTCEKASDCPGATNMCVAKAPCSTQSDCVGSWAVSSTCDGQKCDTDPRYCESENDCYSWCLETYADAYASGGFSYCEDQIWQCQSSNGCDSGPKSCQPLAACDTNADCVDSWVYDYSCVNGACEPELVDCQDPNACYEGCLSAYESTYEVVSDFSYCEDQVWSCQ